MSTQIFLTPAMGKRLIARYLCSRGDVQLAANEHTLVVVSGTTNACFAKMLLEQLGESCGYTGDFDPACFFRGITKPAGTKGGAFAGDVILQKGRYIRGKTVFDVDFQKGDMIVKGANAVNLAQKEAGVLIGNPQLGTSAPLLAAAVGKKVQLLVPVGVEKRVEAPIMELSRLCRSEAGAGLGLLPLPGEIVTELEALQGLFGVKATLFAAGGVCGFEGGSWFHISGEPQAVSACVKEASDLRGTENFML